MGFDAIWISPIPAQIDSEYSYHGYWMGDLDKVNEHFGSADDLRSLVDAAHKREMKIVLDLVMNHVGPIGEDYGVITPFSTAESYHKECQVTQYTCFTEEILHCRLDNLPDLDQSNETVANELIDWITSSIQTYGFDGLRVDTVMYVNIEFWQRFQKAVGPTMMAMAEVDTGDVACVATYQKQGLNSALSYPLYFTLRSVFASGASMNQIQSQLQAYEAAFDVDGLESLANFIDNGDVPRFLYQNQDKVPQYLNALTFVMLNRGTSIIYYGTAQLFDGGNDPDNREPLWPSNYDTTTPMYSFLATVNKIRKEYAIWLDDFTQRYSDDTFYAFSRGDLFVALTNSLDVQTRDITYSPYTSATKLCNLLAKPTPLSDCITTDGNGDFEVTLGLGYPKVLAPFPKSRD